MPAYGTASGRRILEAILIASDIDIIVYHLLTSKVHQYHIAYHEFGNVLAGNHQVVSENYALHLLASSIDPIPRAKYPGP
ncbi:hypothetical protein JK2ML_0292 [Mycobacterium leprae Kyoto-2]|uniref:Uncharacterized protein n=3 Tax=Mycobacterium leprae TaxID=1769 RepID=Q9CCX2_MYCLE|nr:hypothetical protein DIJ64_01550 [Mycobacterium leprae]OAR20061.1 hypothetical protein A8144_12445 [Mycobacterium leprae 3125609]OAX70406.1 hypothetical protein A3216_12105 [Mycobacterium leprae 7935681]CAR70385.1 hypothetical protein MLBr00292 [Mycobacterium leprae Br4923]BBC16491.1 hypothetical protein JK2ML_0292 [Mycobacterium leprae Kyoto-2]